jgi:hypothetical protein
MSYSAIAAGTGCVTAPVAAHSTPRVKVTRNPSQRVRLGTVPDHGCEHASGAGLHGPQQRFVLPW